MEGQEGDKKDVRRPMNAFLIFCKRHRSMVREKNPDLDNRSVTRILGDLWANLAEEKKSVYTTLAKQYKDAFMKANPDYKWHNPDKIHQPPAKMATRPTNARVIKNDVEINLDGSIVPGKLADPSKMGGLSLLLMAGQQNMPGKSDGSSRERHDSEALTSPTDVSPTSSKSALLELAEMCTSELEHDPDEVEKQHIQPLESTLKSPKLKQPTPEYSFQPQYTSHISDIEPIDLSLKPPKSQQEDFSKSDFTSIRPLSDVTKLTVQDEKMPAEVKPKLVELMKTKKDIFPIEKHITDVGLEPKDMGNTKTKKDLPKEYCNGSSDSDQNDNEIVNCGKMMVDHIIDKLYLAQSEGHHPDTQAENQKASKIDAVSMETSIKKEEKDLDIKGEKDEKVDSAQMSDERCDDDGSDKDGGSKRPHDMESQENDDLVPVRKSRRRNRGQRYQELINEGIIQPSKERLAARKAAKTVPDEEIEEDEEFMPVEEVIEKKPTRKRMISEGEDGEDLKKYKTGDFDLEAHIADLPACSLEQLSKGKKNAARARHLSESSIRKPPAPIATKEESTSCLPPHVKLKPVNQTAPENIVGSRRRKFRKHSITHLIPANSVKDIPQSANIPTDAQVLVPDIRNNRSQSLDVSIPSTMTYSHTVKDDAVTEKTIVDNSKERVSPVSQIDSQCHINENLDVVESNKDLKGNENSSEKSKNDKSNIQTVYEGSKVDLETHAPKSVAHKNSDTVNDKDHNLLSTSSDNTNNDYRHSEKLDLQDTSDLTSSTKIVDNAIQNASKTVNENLMKGEEISEMDNLDVKSSENSVTLTKSDSGNVSESTSSESSSDIKPELYPLKETEPALSAPALRMDILATEMKAEDTSLQCQGSPTVAAVHS